MADYQVNHISFPVLEDYVKDTPRPKVCFDIETGPADETLLRSMFDDSQVKLPPQPGPFDPSKVKYGNTKDPAKREIKLGEEIQKHNELFASWPSECQRLLDEAWKVFVDESPLFGERCKVLAIGYGFKVQGGCMVCLDMDDNEALLLSRWHNISRAITRQGYIVHHSGHKFDIPVLNCRLWAHGIAPHILINKYNKYEAYSIDTRDTWMQGRYGEGGKLDHIAKAFGYPGKLPGMTGDQFWKVLKEDPYKASQYLERDVVTLVQVANHMNLL